jgi:hypothetical protein
VRRREVEIVLGRIVVAPRYESNIRASRRTGGCSRSARSRHRSSERPAPKCLLISSAEPTAEAAPDPAFALIDAKLLADIAHCAAIDVQDEAEPVSGFDSDAAWEASERCCDACTVVNEADWRLATTPPDAYRRRRGPPICERNRGWWDGMAGHRYGWSRGLALPAAGDHGRGDRGFDQGSSRRGGAGMSNIVTFPDPAAKRRPAPSGARASSIERKNMQTFLFRSRDLILQSDEADLVRDICFNIDRA